MALGAAAAVKSAGLKHIRFAGFDGSPGCDRGRSKRASCKPPLCSPRVFIAQLAVDEADRFLKTGSTGKPELQIIPCDLVTKSNADDFRNFERVR